MYVTINDNNHITAFFVWDNLIALVLEKFYKHLLTLIFTLCPQIPHEHTPDHASQALRLPVRSTNKNIINTAERDKNPNTQSNTLFTLT